MDKRTILDDMNTRLSELNIIEQELESSTSQKAIGTILVYRDKGAPRFYLRERSGKRIYLGDDKKETVSALVQKEYLTKLLHAVRDEKGSLEKCIDKLSRTNDLSIAFESLKEEYKPFVRKYKSEDDKYAKKWISERYYTTKKGAEHPITTLRGDHVRSKSEALIADRLFHAGIPYRYEARLLLMSQQETHTYYPDFTILNKRTRKVIYWEHLGKLGDQNYCETNLDKLDVYSRFGIVQGKNLILTYECANKPLSTDIVNTLIKEFLI